MAGSDTVRQLTLAFRLDQYATLDNFHVNAANRPVVTHLREQLALAGDDPAVASGTVVRRFTWLSGVSGSGRSHLLQALCHHAGEHRLAALYLPLRLHRDWQPEMLDGLETMDVLCLDDIDAVAGQSEWEQALFHLYNRIAGGGARLFAAADVRPGELPVQLPDLRSRLQSAAVFRLHSPDDEDRRQALQLRARVRGFTLGDDEARYLLSRSGRSMRDLLDILERLDGYSLETGRRVTIPLIRSLMGW
ncbi:MAG: DnaA regulatory inactivator Hda [Pseudohongiellaceae bacterium]